MIQTQQWQQQWVVRCNQIRLPDGSDILSEEDNETIQYAYSLRKPNAIEVSASDRYRVNGVLSDIRLRGKLKNYSADCDLLLLNVTSRNNHTVRLHWHKGTFAQS